MVLLPLLTLNRNNQFVGYFNIFKLYYISVSPFAPSFMMYQNNLHTVQFS